MRIGKGKKEKRKKKRKEKGNPVVSIELTAAIAKGTGSKV